METLNKYKPRIFKSPKPASAWYALYTKSHHEKEVLRRLQEKGIHAYLPLFTTLRQWSDRKKKVQIPLFSCYIFVNIVPKEYYQVLNTPGVIKYVTFEGKAAPIPEKQIFFIKNIMEEDFEFEVVENKLCSGARVGVIAGSLTGLKGVLIDFRGKKRVIIQLDGIQKSMIVSMPLNLLRLDC